VILQKTHFLNDIADIYIFFSFSLFFIITQIILLRPYRHKSR